MTTVYAISLVCGLISSALFFASGWATTPKRIFAFLFISEGFDFLAFAYNNDLGTAFLHIGSILRAAVFYLGVSGTFKGFPSPQKTWGFIAVFSCVLWLIGVPKDGSIQWYHYLTLLASVISAYGLSRPSVSKLKVMSITVTLMWMTYEFQTGAYALIVGGVLSLTAQLRGFFAARKQEKASELEAEATQQT